MSGRRHSWGLASRFLLAQAIVVAASILAAVAVASLAGPPIFHEHLIMAGHSENSPELLHVEQAYRDTNLIILGAALSTAVVCAAAVTWFFTRRLQRPLAALTQAAQSMARGRYDTRVQALGAGTEVDAVATSFNTMATRLQRTEDTRRRMLSDLAHEMRTPISVLSVYCEALQDGVTHWDEATGELMTDQLGRLTRLVEDIHDVSGPRRAGSSWSAPHNPSTSCCAPPSRPTGRPTPPRACIWCSRRRMPPGSWRWTGSGWVRCWATCSPTPCATHRPVAR